MPKDFAQRAKPSKAKRRTTRSKSRPRVSPTPRTLFHGPSFSFGALLGAAVVILAAYAPELVQQSIPGPVGDPASSPVTDGSNTRPVVEFDFPKLLRNSEVKADPEPYAVPEQPADAVALSYLVQAASFRRREDAETLRAQLLLQDLPATLSESTVGQSRWYRISVGPYTRKVEAERALTKLREQGMDAIFLQR